MLTKQMCSKTADIDNWGFNQNYKLNLIGFLLNFLKLMKVMFIFMHTAVTYNSLLIFFNNSEN